MARDHGRVLCKIWQDKDFRALPRHAQTLYIQLLSQPNVNNAGVLPLMISKWAKGCDDETTASIREALDVLEGARFIVVDTDSEEVLIRSFMRNDGGLKHPYIFKNALKMAEAAEGDLIRRTLAVELRRIRRAEATRVADILDPTETPTKPEVIPSKWHSDPTDIPSESEMAFETHPDRCGEGEGEGEGESLVDGCVGGTRARGGASEPPDETPPPRFCPGHPNGTTERCGGCAEARKNREAWDAANAAADAAAKHAEQRRRATQAAAAASARQDAIDACPMCDHRGYDGPKICHHDPDAGDRAKRHIAEFKAEQERRKAAKDQHE